LAAGYPVSHRALGTEEVPALARLYV
jgi:hypothetical protein